MSSYRSDTSPSTQTGLAGRVRDLAEGFPIDIDGNHVVVVEVVHCPNNVRRIGVGLLDRNGSGLVDVVEAPRDRVAERRARVTTP